MDRYPALIRWFAILLAIFYAVADGHLLCAPCLADDAVHHVGNGCEHSTHPMPTVQPATCCLGEFDGGRLLCNGNDLPAVAAQCATDELLSALMDCSVVFGAVVPVEYLWKAFAFRDAMTFLVSAPSLRLHLLYGVLLN